jgi:hypothetical protein
MQTATSTALVAVLLAAQATATAVPRVTAVHNSGEPNPAAQATPAAAAPRPEWVGRYMESMIGRWSTDNRAYRSEAEPFEAYGMEWSWGIGRQSLVGRLYALKGTDPTVTFWEFREYWHPGEGHLLSAQFGGDGTLGIGPHERRSDGSMEMVQVFHSPSVPAHRVAHRSEIKGGEMVTRSFDVLPDGTWRDRRVYTWKRQAGS